MADLCCVRNTSHRLLTEYVKVTEKYVLQVELHILEKSSDGRYDWFTDAHLQEVVQCLHDKMKQHVQAELTKKRSKAHRETSLAQADFSKPDCLSGPTLRMAYAFRKGLVNQSCIIGLKQQLDDKYNSYEIFIDKLLVYVCQLEGYKALVGQKTETSKDARNDGIQENHSSENLSGDPKPAKYHVIEEMCLSSDYFNAHHHQDHDQHPPPLTAPKLSRTGKTKKKTKSHQSVADNDLENPNPNLVDNFTTQTGILEAESKSGLNNNDVCSKENESPPLSVEFGKERNPRKMSIASKQIEASLLLLHQKDDLDKMLTLCDARDTKSSDTKQDNRLSIESLQKSNGRFIIPDPTDVDKVIIVSRNTDTPDIARSNSPGDVEESLVETGISLDTSHEDNPLDQSMDIVSEYNIPQDTLDCNPVPTSIVANCATKAMCEGKVLEVQTQTLMVNPDTAEETSSDIASKSKYKKGWAKRTSPDKLKVVCFKPLDKHICSLAASGDEQTYDYVRLQTCKVVIGQKDIEQAHSHYKKLFYESTVRKILPDYDSNSGDEVEQSSSSNSHSQEDFYQMKKSDGSYKVKLRMEDNYTKMQNIHASLIDLSNMKTEPTESATISEVISSRSNPLNEGSDLNPIDIDCNRVITSEKLALNLSSHSNSSSDNLFDRITNCHTSENNSSLLPAHIETLPCCDDHGMMPDTLPDSQKEFICDIPLKGIPSLNCDIEHSCSEELVSDADNETGVDKVVHSNNSDDLQNAETLESNSGNEKIVDGNTTNEVAAPKQKRNKLSRKCAVQRNAKKAVDVLQLNNGKEGSSDSVTKESTCEAELQSLKKPRRSKGKIQKMKKNQARARALENLAMEMEVNDTPYFVHTPVDELQLSLNSDSDSEELVEFNINSLSSATGKCPVDTTKEKNVKNVTNAEANIMHSDDELEQKNTRPVRKNHPRAKKLSSGKERSSPNKEAFSEENRNKLDQLFLTDGSENSASEQTISQNTNANEYMCVRSDKISQSATLASVQHQTKKKRKKAIKCGASRKRKKALRMKKDVKDASDTTIDNEIDLSMLSQPPHDSRRYEASPDKFFQGENRYAETICVSGGFIIENDRMPDHDSSMEYSQNESEHSGSMREEYYHHKSVINDIHEDTVFPHDTANADINSKKMLSVRKGRERSCSLGPQITDTSLGQETSPLYVDTDYSLETMNTSSVAKSQAEVDCTSDYSSGSNITSNIHSPEALMSKTLPQDDTSRLPESGSDGKSLVYESKSLGTHCTSMTGISASQSIDVDSVTEIEDIFADCFLREQLETVTFIKVEDEYAQRMDEEIAEVNSVAELSEVQLEYLVSVNSTYLKNIFKGKKTCRRHEEYKKGGSARAYLSWEVPVALYTEEQCDFVMSTLMGIFCSRHTKYLDYVMRVMMPEILIKIYMDINDCAHDEAQNQMNSALRHAGAVKL